MPPLLALASWFVLLLALLRFDPAKEKGISPALWVPIIWLFITGSRLPSQWLAGQLATQAGGFEEGNPLDRITFSILIVAALIILASRSFRWDAFLTRNFFLVAFILFALVSVVWSDFPLVAIKRWFRDLGNYLVILVVLSDPRPPEAVTTVIRRLCYLLVPLSVVLMKYFPTIGRYYLYWTGSVTYMGATTSKNNLGALCLISGLFFLWDTLRRWPERKQRQTKRVIRLNLVFIAMTLWTLNLANSATSRACLMIGSLVLLAAHSKAFQRYSTLLKILIPAVFVLYIVLAFGFDMNSQVAGAVGRDPTFTDRTNIWALLLSMKTNPLVGTGYESFWLGPRLSVIWSQFGTLNEAHDGYLEVYLNLGLIGVALLCGFLFSSYQKICKNFTVDPSVFSFSLAFWAATVFYNITEAAFKAHIMWLAFLLIAIAAPARAAERTPSSAELDITQPTPLLPRLNVGTPALKSNRKALP